MRNKDLQLFNETIAKVKFFGNLSENWKQDLHRKMHILPFKKGEIVFKEGKPAGAFLVVAQGTLSVVNGEQQEHNGNGRNGKNSRNGKNGKNGMKKIKELSAADFYGASELMLESIRQKSVTAKEDSLLFLMGKSDFITMINENPEIRPEIDVDLTLSEPQESRVEDEDRESTGKGRSLFSKLKGFIKFKKND